MRNKLGKFSRSQHRVVLQIFTAGWTQASQHQSFEWASRSLTTIACFGLQSDVHTYTCVCVRAHVCACVYICVCVCVCDTSATFNFTARVSFVISNICCLFHHERSGVDMWDTYQCTAHLLLYIFFYCIFYFQSSLNQHGLTLFPAWICNHVHSIVWYEIIYPLSNVNGTAVEVWQWISNFISHFIVEVIDYPCWE